MTGRSPGDGQDGRTAQHAVLPAGRRLPCHGRLPARVGRGDVNESTEPAMARQGH
ncbi:hypothetical protein J3R04_003209 [Spirilliplanes yamanashiensis]|nr:hypothetical protein [Spirilliplanes yamanashiensis]